MKGAYPWRWGYCATCHAKTGEICMLFNGKVLKAGHPTRRHAWLLLAGHGNQMRSRYRRTTWIEEGSA